MWVTDEITSATSDGDDANLSQLELSNKISNEAHQMESARTNYYDRLVQQFPDNAWLIALRLRHTFQTLRHSRVGGELSDGNLLANLAAGKPSLEERPEDVNYTQAEWKRAVEMCRRGQRLEPDNAYFDWVLAYLLLANHRDAEAFQVLDKGSRKARYDDHSASERIALKKAHELVVGRPLLWEEKAQLLSSVDMNMSLHARYRELARLITWLGIKAQRRGDHKQALLVYGSLMRMGNRMMLDADSFIDALVASALGSIARVGPARVQRTAASVRWRKQKQAAVMREYFARHGRHDLVHFAAQAETAETVLRKRVTAWTATGSVFNVPLTTAAITNSLWRAGVFLLLTMLPALCLWSAASLISVRCKAVDGEPHAQRRVVVIALLLCLAMYVLLLCCGTIGPPLGSKGKILEARWLAALAPALVGLVYCLGKASQWQRRSYRHEISLVQQLRAALAPGASHFPFLQDLWPVARLIIEIGLVVLLAGSWMVLGFWTNDDYTFVPVLGIALVSIVSLLWAVGRWLRLPGRRAALRFVLSSYRSTLGVFLVTASMMWFLLALVSLPLRQEADRRIDDIIQYGEVRAALK